MKGVIVVAAILAAAGIGLAPFFTEPFSRRADALNVRATKIELMEQLSGLESFRKDCGRYPTTAEGLGALHTKPKESLNGWNGPYTRKLADRDAWGNRYLYIAKDEGFELLSFGADGKPGGEGDDVDLVVNG